MKRIFVLAAIAAAFLGMFAARPSQAQQPSSVVTALGSPYLVDFFARQSKQADLRQHVASVGLNTAFSDWLSSAHPDAFRRAVRQSAFNSTPSDRKVTTRAGRVSGSCCVMAAGCCPMCPTCCEQKSCAKGCCNLSACAMRPNCCKS